MSGLILQDMLAMKKVIKTYVAVLVLYVIFGVMNNQASQFGAFFVFFAVFLSISVFAFREKNKWDINVAVMPISRSEMVKSTYFMSMGFLLIAVLCVCGLNMVDIITKGLTHQDGMELFGVTGIISFLGSVYLSLLLPILFKFGVDRGRIIIMAAFLIPFAIVMILTKSGVDLGSIETFILKNGKMLPWILGSIAIAVVFLSYYVSVQIYRKKEF